VGRTVQLGDAQALADRCGVPVAFDFRTADVAAGGEGAPLAPIYHRARALASGLTLPVAVLNIGGVANVTLIGKDDELLAFDTGPGNGMIDLLLQAHDAGRYDEGGRLAASGWVDEDALQTLFDHPYFAAPPPKSLDRYDFALDAVADLSLPDAAATLVAFTARTVALGVAQAKQKPTAIDRLRRRAAQSADHEGPGRGHALPCEIRRRLRLARRFHRGGGLRLSRRPAPGAACPSRFQRPPASPSP
jgi:anhydro-N-acetylmuramic acid kinase